MLHLKELSLDMQKMVTGGMNNNQFCLEKFGPCPPGTIYTYNNGNCYCTQDGDGSIGGGGNDGGSGGYVPCAEKDICVPADGCSSWVIVGIMAANNM